MKNYIPSSMTLIQNCQNSNHGDLDPPLASTEEVCLWWIGICNQYFEKDWAHFREI